MNAAEIKDKEMFRLLTDPDTKTKIGWMVADGNGEPACKHFCTNYGDADGFMSGLRYDDYFDQPEVGDELNIIKVIVARIHKNDWRVIAYIDGHEGQEGIYEMPRDLDGGCFQADVGLKEL
jgi:hypothetical protein